VDSNAASQSLNYSGEQHGANVVSMRGGADAYPEPCYTGAERRRDYEERVRYQCRLASVPLRVSDQGDVYFLVVKPALDKLIASLLLLALAPFLLLIALAIKLHDGGPVFFVQSRTGYLGERFPLHGGSPDFKAANDPRITPVGQLLRSWSLDELPNLVNVLRGELSLVGPRPTSFDVSTYASRHLTRLAVRPGITGLWQVSGRALIGFDRRCEMDETYIRRASLRTDLALLFRTAGAVLRRQGAL
jgi:lipopolysaccharide/colanic/teichoic acid biosynthesis glycosyltransferase